MTATWSDVYAGLSLAVLYLLPFAISHLARGGAPSDWLVSGLSPERLSVTTLLRLLCAAVSRDLVLRVYVLTEVQALTNSAALALTASVCLPILATFDVAPSVSLLFGSLFYWKTRRATPLVVGTLTAWLWLLLHPTAS
jgi:hypothetical protein